MLAVGDHIRVSLSRVARYRSSRFASNEGGFMIRKLCFSLFALLLVAPAIAAEAPIKVLIITGDHGHDWKTTTPFLKDLLTKANMAVDVTETPSKNLTADNLAKYDVLFLHYKDTKAGKPESRWSDENKKAFADAI